MSDRGYLHRRSDDFGKMPEALMHDTTITDGAKVLYSHMHWRYGSACNNFEGRKSMADMLGVKSETTITNRVNELVEHNWIVRVDRRDENKTNYYHVFELQSDCLTWKLHHQTTSKFLEQGISKNLEQGNTPINPDGQTANDGKKSSDPDSGYPESTLSSGKSSEDKVSQPPKSEAQQASLLSFLEDNPSPEPSQGVTVPLSTPDQVPTRTVGITKQDRPGSKKPRAAKTLWYVFKLVNGVSTYIGPAPSEKAAREMISAGDGTLRNYLGADGPCIPWPKKPKPVQPWDALGEAIATHLFGAKDRAGVNAVYGRVAPILHGTKRGEGCEGLIAYECERQSRTKHDFYTDATGLDYAALAKDVPVFWKDYKRINPNASGLKDCTKVLDAWQAWRGRTATRKVDPGEGLHPVDEDGNRIEVGK